MLTSTEDFKGKIKEIKPKFIKYLEDYNTELTKESSRNTVFSDAIYLANHPELQIDFFGVLSGKIAMEQYNVKLIEHIEKLNQKDLNASHAIPKSRANQYINNMERFCEFLYKNHYLAR